MSIRSEHNQANKQKVVAKYQLRAVEDFWADLYTPSPSFYFTKPERLPYGGVAELFRKIQGQSKL